jgi:hypothetical protein
VRQPATIGALLLVTVGVILGATVFRTDIAQATGLADKPAVTVVNTPAQAVPVREQNLDGGSIKVHEQGTVKVNSTDNPAQPFRIDMGFGGLAESFTVPANKRLVIQEVTGRVSADGDHRSTGGIMRLDVQTAAGLLLRPLFFADDGYFYRPDVPDTSFVVTEQATVYVEPGQKISPYFIIGGVTDASELTGEMTIIGYLVDV